MKYVIDRFENHYAIAELEDKSGYVNIPKAALPPSAKEGDVISIEIDLVATQKRKEQADKLRYHVWDNDNTLEVSHD